MLETHKTYANAWTGSVKTASASQQQWQQSAFLPSVSAVSSREMFCIGWYPLTGRRPPGGIQQDYDCGFCSALPWRDETLSLEIFNLPGERFNGIMAAAAILAFVCLLLSDR